MTIAVTVKVIGLNKARVNFQRYATRIPMAGRRGVWLFTNKLAKRLREEAKIRGHKSRGYLSSEKGTHAKKIDKDTWAVQMPFYTPYLEKGASRGKGIPPKPKVLFWQRKKGAYIVGKRVTQAHPFTAHVINREIKNLRETVEKQINRELR